MVCFCILEPGFASDADLESTLSDTVVAELGRPMRPARILFVDDLPRTRSAKVMRRVLRAAYLDEELGDTTSLVNPEAGEAVRGLASLGLPGQKRSPRGPNDPGSQIGDPAQPPQ